MFSISGLEPKNEIKNQRVIDAGPSDRGKRHYWQLDKGDYGMYQSQEKAQIKLSLEKYNKDRHLSELKRSNKESIDKNQNKNYLRKKSASQVRDNYGKIKQQKVVNNEQEYQQQYQPHKKVSYRPSYPRNIDHFQSIDQVKLPSIKKSEKQVQTTNTLLEFTPKSKNMKINHHRSKTMQNDYQVNIPHSFAEKKKFSLMPRVKKIGHEEDERYDKYENTGKNRIKTFSIREYMKYTPTFASSDNNILSHYAVDAPEEY